MTEAEHYLAIGDIHGMKNKLDLVLTELAPALPSDTRLIFVGDYVDRGPDSKEVIERLIRLKDERPDTILLMGNHERMMIDAYDGGDVMTWLSNGGDHTLKSYGLSSREIKELPSEHIEFIRTLDLMYEIDGYIFVHAGLRPGVPVRKQKEHDLLWIRESFFLAEPTWDETVVFGHTPFPTPFRRPGMIGIDTGAVYNNKLCCLELPGETFHRL
jgi:serine/threonine protein phosphatase 1